MHICNQTLYLTIHRCLKIDATLAVVSGKRSFSSLRRLKTYSRNKTVEKPLNGMPLLNLYKGYGGNVQKSHQIPRRINFIL